MRLDFLKFVNRRPAAVTNTNPRKGIPNGLLRLVQNPSNPVGESVAALGKGGGAAAVSCPQSRINHNCQMEPDKNRKRGAGESRIAVQVVDSLGAPGLN